ncbi:MAG: FAD-binding protein [Gammaproteobacteria bacterium]|nr:FAD-binding protein [Gammaproteobacteria bacterium]MYH85920.1 FAD-binding protein [Gammaproteobacteria bacterium]MYK05892.1 FAD-binding protein [Gammaproteobacteria bacterium]
MTSGNLQRRLEREIRGQVWFDAFNRGRYSTDASIYQIMPVGVTVPADEEDAAAALAIAEEEGVPVLPRGAGTSQNGQAIGEALILDCTRHLNNVVDFDAGARTVCVQPGIVLEQLNRYLKPHGLFYPVDVSTANRATIGGMTGNNSCGARSIRYGNMVHNVRSIEALLAGGVKAHFRAVSGLGDSGNGDMPSELVENLLDLGDSEADEIRRRFPKLLRRVGGYNIDELTLDRPNLARLLVGSEGTLGFFRRIHLDLQPIPPHKVLGICHFARFYDAMDSVRHIVKLNPAAVELMDRTMIELAREIPLFAPTVARFVKGEPDALLLVEFAGDDHGEQLASLRQLVELVESLSENQRQPSSVVEAVDPSFQQAVWEVRASGLNIMMSMKGDAKPVSFIEDCAVALEDLAEYTARLSEVFARHGTTGTFYAHASVGCLHVRPVLDMKQAGGAKAMRSIAEEALEMVREYKGSHSGEHGDGISRSEFHEPMFGRRMVENFEQVKRWFDPDNVFNPGKIVNPHRFDDRAIMRYPSGYQCEPVETALDWSAWQGYDRALEMCNNNGACRKAQGGVMCPSFRVTGEEVHLTRGRANSLRLALSGAAGAEALQSKELYETMALCVGCKACRRECPTGVDMARMKIEFLHQHRRLQGSGVRIGLRDRLFAWLPRYAHRLGPLGSLLDLRDRLTGLALLSQWLFGLSANRPLPRWRRDRFRPDDSTGEGREVVLLVDTFNSCFESENARAAQKVLQAAGYRVAAPAAGDSRPLCCGRTFLSSGLVDEAKAEARRMLEALRPFVERGVPIVGLEPSCLLSLRDEYLVMGLGPEAEKLADNAVLFEEFFAAEHEAGRLALKLKPLAQKRALVHGHCHQKSFAVMPALNKTLALVPELEIEVIDSSCCGMAGSFGYEAEHYRYSMDMAELSLLPAVRAADEDSLIVANGVSCRGQIGHGASREALHVARVLEMALA